jgi:hypothetical protein
VLEGHPWPILHRRGLWYKDDEVGTWIGS